MNIFLSKYINKVDKKGRTSVPAGYRSILTAESFNGVVVYPSFRNQCIEACGLSRIKELSKIIENLDPYSDERDAFEAVILSESMQLQFDGEGRVVLPSHLMQTAKITDQACFVGKGVVFEIWQPKLFEEYLKSAKELARNNRFILKNKVSRFEDQ